MSVAHRYWDNKLNPLPERAERYLEVVEGENFTGHPVNDLVEIVFDCYEILSSILTNYNPTGDDSQDKCVVALSQLFVHWPADKLALVKASMDCFVPPDISHPNDLETVHERIKDSEGTVSVAGESIAQYVKSGFGCNIKTSSQNSAKASKAPEARKSSATRPRTKSGLKRRSGESETGENPDSVSALSQSCSPPRPGNSPTTTLKPEASVLVPSIPPQGESPASAVNREGRSSGAGGSHELSTKNQEYFRKMREEEELVQRTKKEEASKLTPEELKRIEDERKEAERHDANKTAHLSKLGSNFLNRKDGRVKTDGGGRGGRGRGGRG